MNKTLLISLVVVGTSAFAQGPRPKAKFIDQPNQVIGEARQLTFQGPRSGEGYFSADGRQMIFQGEREPGNPFYQIYVMDLGSGESRRISTGKGKTTCGWIHPAGKKALWSSTHLDPKFSDKVKSEYEERKQPVKSRYSWSYDEHFDIFESDLRGGSLKRLTKEVGYDAEASYSPDGQWIAFASNRKGYTEKLSADEQKLFERDPSYMMDIYIMKSDGTQVRQLTSTRGYDGGPFFSADGKKITWRRFTPDGSKAEIFTMNIDGSNQQAITRLGSMSWAPYFHPSGDYVIFASSVLGYSNFELFIVDADGKRDPVRVTFNEGFDGLAAFSPDGHQLTWTLRNEKGESQIMLAPWNDAEARKLLGLPPRTPDRLAFQPEVRVPDLKQWVSWMASEEMKGRQAGSPEETEMMKNLAQTLESWGLVGAAPGGGFLHPFEFTSAVERGEKNSLELKGKFQRSLKLGSEAEPYSLSATAKIPESPLVFVGFGIKAPATAEQAAFNSYQDLDVSGKWVVILPDLPGGMSAARRQHLSLYSRLQHKVTVAREAGAKGVIILDGRDPLKPTPGRALRFEGHLAATSLPVWRVGGRWIDELFKASGQNFNQVFQKAQKGEVVQFPFVSTYAASETELIAKKSKAMNVLARWPSGRRSSKAVLIGAHADHLGTGISGNSLAKGRELNRAHLGADDNASGVAAVLEMAHWFSSQKQKPAQDLVFGFWSAEEIGLLGSHAFVRDWEAASKKDFKESFSAALNLDMVGRLRGTLQVQGVGSGDHWSQLAEEVTAKTGVPMTLTSDPHLPTDAMSFYLAEIPSISFFTGAHSEYHTPADRPELIDFAGLQRVTNAALEMTRTLASAQTPLVSYRKVEGNPGSRLEGRSFRIYLGTIPDYSQEGVRGVRISGASKGSPAEKAGLKAKDVIVEFAGAKIENIYDYVYALQTAKANEETPIKVRRANGSTVDLRIVPQLKE